jgi:hypothetical protein
MIDALGELPSRCVLRRKEFHGNSAGTLKAIASASVPLAKKVRGSHRSDLTNARKFTIVRSVNAMISTSQHSFYCSHEFTG